MGTIRRTTGEYVGEVGSNEIFGKPFLCVYGKTKPRHYDENVVERQLADGLMAYVRYEASDKVKELVKTDAGTSISGTILVKKEHLEFLGLDEDTLFQQASENSGAEVESFAKFLADMGLPILPGGEPPIYILRSRTDIYGAGAIANEAVLKNIYENMGAFAIIPASIHEVILLPKSLLEDCGPLVEMVKEVNDTTVDLSDQLSDNVYEYDETGLHIA